MTRHELKTLLEQVRSGVITPESAQDRFLQYLRQAPFEDLGFARVDHHRSARQGFPEVIFGPGKSPEQIASIAERIVAAGHTLLVTRTDATAHAAVAERIPDARFHSVARAITRRVEAPPTGKGTILVIAAGTADQAAAEEAAICAETMRSAIAAICAGVFPGPKITSGKPWRRLR